jgi:hypothetical protein
MSDLHSQVAPMAVGDHIDRRHVAGAEFLRFMADLG